MYSVDVQTDVVILFEDDMESGTNGWTTEADASTTAGFWELAVPVGTVNAGIEFAPSTDASTDGTRCWVTQNGAPGGSAGAADVDNGPVTLTSPTFDLSSGNAGVSFNWWCVNDDAGTASEDRLSVQLTNGGPWVEVMNFSNGSPGWNFASIDVASHIEPTSTVAIRFIIADAPNNSLTECAIDDLIVDRVECESGPNCPEDMNGDGMVNGADLGLLLAAWGSEAGDFNGDGTTNGADLGLMLAMFGTDC